MAEEMRYGDLELVPVSHYTISESDRWNHGPYLLWLHTSHFKGKSILINKTLVLKVFGNKKSSNKGSQQQIQSRYEAMATYRTIKFLISTERLENPLVAKKIIDIAANAARTEMENWKKGKVPGEFNYANYLHAVRLRAQPELEKYR